MFTETENEDLNALFKEIQEKIIFPAHLPVKQRDIVFDAQKRSYLEQNPIVIELDGQEHKFSTINRFTEIPNSKSILDEALKKMHTKEDWDNLGTLLHGYHKAGIKLSHTHVAKIIRMAGQSGQIFSILECAKQVQKTNLALNQKEYVVQVLNFINEKIVSSSWDPKETTQAAKWTKLVWELIQRPGHLDESLSPVSRLHYSAIVQGLKLFTEASAIKAKQAASEDVGADLQELKAAVDQLLTVWGERYTEDLTKDSDLKDLIPALDKTNKRGHFTSMAPSYFVRAIAQNIKAMEMTQELLGDSAKDLTPIKAALDAFLGDFVKSIDRIHKSPDDIPRIYEEITGRKPAWK